ncbi:carbohydrate-binding domain-containing protein [Azospirillum sp. sgz301742]
MASQMLFDDEFNSFDAYSKTDAWHTAYHWGPNSVINGEKGYYVDTENAGTTGPAGAVNPFSVNNGVLTITSAPTTKALPTGQSYTTGVISSMGTFEHTYGYYEMRADLSGGKGFWPAFWLMPADKISPPELDIMEFSSRLPNEYVTTLHSNAGGTYKMSQQFTQNLPDLSQGYHTYGVDWQSDKITWYFDNKAVYSVATPSDMHKPMYMLLNQAAGSSNSWIGLPDGSTQQYNIDYVRVYDTKPTDTATAPAPTPTPTPTPTTGNATVVVNASGTPAAGVNAHFNVLIDGVKIGEATAGTTAKDYSFTAGVAASTAHKVEVQFDNNANTTTEDRNLIVNKMTINGNAVLPTSSTVVYDRGALDGVDVLPGQSMMYWNGTLVASTPSSYYPAATTTTPTTPTTTASGIVVNASGSPAGGVNAHFNLLIDGKKVGEGTTDTTAKDFVFNPTMTTDAAHKVQVQFDNDANINGADRNLFVNKITINGQAVAPTASIVTYDKGALDGKDVVAGQSSLWWNGTLVVNADKSYFPAAKAAAAAAAQADTSLETWLHLNPQSTDAPASGAAAADHPVIDPSAFTLHDMAHTPDIHTDMTIQNYNAGH